MSHVKYVGPSCYLLLTFERLCIVSLHFPFISQLHDITLALHDYTPHQRRATRGVGAEFYGELDNFPESNLSSIARLVRFRHNLLTLHLLMALCVEHGWYSAAIMYYGSSIFLPL